jgi:hypothetical protein
MRESLHHPAKSVLTARGRRVLTLRTVSKGFEPWSLKGSTGKAENYIAYGI